MATHEPTTGDEMPARLAREARMPDSATVSEAASIVRAAFDDTLWNHTLRTHLLAVGWAERFDLRFEPEQLALACLFHDLGMVPPWRDPAHAFTFAGSHALRDFLEERGWEPRRIEAAMRAIDFHMQLRPRWDLGGTAGLLQVAAWMDVTGLRSRRLPAVVKEARRRFDRSGFFLRFNACVLRELASPRRALGLLFPERFAPPSRLCGGADQVGRDSTG